MKFVQAKLVFIFYDSPPANFSRCLTSVKKNKNYHHRYLPARVSRVPLAKRPRGIDKFFLVSLLFFVFLLWGYHLIKIFCSPLPPPFVKTTPTWSKFKFRCFFNGSESEPLAHWAHLLGKFKMCAIINDVITN